MENRKENIDQQMHTIREFIDEFYNKTVFKGENGNEGTDLAPSFIKSLFAFQDPDALYPMGELAKMARVKSSTMTDMVDRMEKDGMAERIRDNNDRRLVKVCLTEKGKKIRLNFYEKRRQEFQTIFSQLHHNEVQQFINHLAEATRILKKIQ